MTVDLTDPIFHDEAKATAHMEADRWPDGVFCPFCGSTNVHRMGGKTQAGMFLCNDCRDKFTVHGREQEGHERASTSTDAQPRFISLGLVYVPSHSREHEARLK